MISPLKESWTNRKELISLPRKVKSDKEVGSDSKKKSNRTAISPQARENQIISAAYDLAERRILNGTASSQEIIHFLRMGSEKEKLERTKLQEENRLLRQKTKSLEASSNIEQLLKDGLNALNHYRANDREDDIFED